MQQGSLYKLSGHIEVDETYVGGKARNMHRSDRARKIHGTGFEGKVAVMGLLERHGEVHTMVVRNNKRKALRPEINAHVEPGSMVYTDSLRSYNDLNYYYMHNVINHAEKYVEGNVHTHGIENFWSLLKRTIGGTYVSVEPFHLFRYLDEQAFRFNRRKGTDADRFFEVLCMVTRKRLQFAELTGRAAQQDGGKPRQKRGKRMTGSKNLNKMAIV